MKKINHRIPRIILLSSGGADFFESLEAAERSMEAIDVLDGEYIAAWMRDGTVLDIKTNLNRPAYKWKYFSSVESAPVYLNAREGSPKDLVGLEVAVREYFQILEIDCDNLSLNELLEMACDYLSR